MLLNFQMYNNVVDSRLASLLLDLHTVYNAITEYQYINDHSWECAGHYNATILNNLIYDFSDRAFWAECHMQRNLFWKLVDLWTSFDTTNCWQQCVDSTGCVQWGTPTRSIYHQLAVGLYILRQMTTIEIQRIHENIAYISMPAYIWRLINLLNNHELAYIR